jgi:NAD(P)-dependent dehydrogenase (short-subunit alcohol dehydrogenase family)
MRSHLVTARVLDAFGTVEWLSERDVFDFEYWPLELYKLQAAPSPREFSGRVAIVTGAGSTIGRAVAARLAREGAHLVLSDGDEKALHQFAMSFPVGTVHVADGDTTAAAIAAFGGVDLLLALASITSTTRDRLGPALQQQGLGGTVVGLVTPSSTDVDLGHPLGTSVRTNVVHVDNAAEPESVAEAVAFLASARAAATDGTTLLVGSKFD